MKKLIFIGSALLALGNLASALTNTEKQVQRAWLDAVKRSDSQMIKDVVRNFPILTASYRAPCSDNEDACYIAKLLTSAKDEEGNTAMMIAVQHGSLPKTTPDNDSSAAYQLVSQDYTGSAKVVNKHNETVWDKVLAIQDEGIKKYMANRVALMTESHLCNNRYLSSLDRYDPLIKGDLNSCIRDANANTALHLAIPYLRQQKAQAMVDNTPEGYVDLQNNDGDTALHVAAKSGNCRGYLALYLLGNGMYLAEKADKTLVNNAGQTAQEIMNPKVQNATCLFKLIIKALHERAAAQERQTHDEL